MKAAAQLHDQVNLILLPLLGVAAIAGLGGIIDPYSVTIFLSTYILADLLWIWLQPTCLPSLPKVIMAHHAVTLVLLSFPLRFPEFGVYTCLDALAEVNTYFLIARRQYKQWAGVCDVLYWVTFIPFRLVLYPGLLVPFAQSLAGYSLLDNVLCLGAQGLLCLFNVALLYLSVKGLLKRRRQCEVDDASKVACGDSVCVGGGGGGGTGQQEADVVELSDGSSRSSVDVMLEDTPMSGGGRGAAQGGVARRRTGGVQGDAGYAYENPPVAVQPRLVAAS